MTTPGSDLNALMREIGSVCRGVAVKVAEGEVVEKLSIDGAAIPDYLGPNKFVSEVADRTSEPGVATGLAWTAVGGDILFIEATRMPGKGKLTLTGQLGDVMQESARAALSFVRSRADTLGIDPTPVQQYMQRLGELREMLRSGAITDEQFRAEAMEALPDKVKSILDRTKSPLQKYREQLAELRQFHDLGLINKKQFAMAAQELGKDVFQLPSMDDVVGSFRSMGTFSAAAAFGLSAGGVNDRETKAAEATAQNTQKLVDHARRGRLVFA